jgi:hypothetical protein
MTDSPFVKILITHRNNELLTIERYGIAGSFRRDGSAGHDPFPGIELNVVIHEDFETSLSRFDYDYLVVPNDSPLLKLSKGRTAGEFNKRWKLDISGRNWVEESEEEIDEN